MKLGQPITLRFSNPSYDAEINVNSLTWAGMNIGTPVNTIAGATGGPITTTSLVTADWPLTPAQTLAPAEDLTADPRLDDVPLALLKRATLLDPPKPFPTYHAAPVELVKTATLKLDASELTRLITLVDTDKVWVDNAYALVDTDVFSETQTRRWFQDWNRVVAPAAFAGGLTRARLLELLREARRRVRRLHPLRPRPIRSTRRIRQQLDRLANFIAPHAPPAGPLFQRPARAAAIHLAALA